MVVKSRSQVQTNSGQSVLEFLLLLPVLVGFVVVLVRVNTAMQISIVNQQYSRAHTLWLAFNSSIYPQFSQRDINFISKNYNRIVIGVAENSSPDEEDLSYRPVAMTQKITRKPKPGKDDSAVQQETDFRTEVRVRNTVTLCTQSNVIIGEGRSVPLTPENLRKFGEGQNKSASLFQYCRSPLENE